MLSEESNNSLEYETQYCNGEYNEESGSSPHFKVERGDLIVNVRGIWEDLTIDDWMQMLEVNSL